MIKKVDNLGGEKLLIEKFDQVQEIAQRLDTVDSQIKLSIDNCLNQYLPDFKAGKVQIEQWRKETLSETQTTLNTINQKTQSIDTSIERLNQDFQSVRVLLNECERKELQLQSILDAITELTKSFGGEPLVSATIKKLTVLDNFIAQEKSLLSHFKKELEESLDDEFEELIQRDEERITGKLADLDNFIISAKSTLNNIKKQMDEGLEQKLNKLVSQNLQDLKKQQAQLEERLRNEFQGLLREEILKLENEYLQEIQKMRKRHFRLL